MRYSQLYIYFIHFSKHVPFAFLFREYLTGFHKRKVERRKAAVAEIKKKIKDEQIRVREEVSPGTSFILNSYEHVVMEWFCLPVEAQRIFEDAERKERSAW